MLCGGHSAPRNADENTEALCFEVRGLVEAQLARQFTVFQPVSYTSQVVAGTVYKIKLRVDGDEYIHIRVFKPLSCNSEQLELKDATGGHTLESQL
jgi:cystatin-A/B